MKRIYLKSAVIFAVLAAILTSYTVDVYAEPHYEKPKEPTEIAYGDTDSGEYEEKALEGLDGEGAMTVSSGTSTYDFFGTNKVPNGIYAFGSLGNSGLWMDIQYDSTEAGYHVQQFAYAATPAENQTQAALFKLEQVGTTGRYIIRLMLNQSLSFGFDDGEFLTKEIPAVNSEVDIADTFYVEYNGGAYTIRQYGRNGYVSAQDTTASGMTGAPDSYLMERSLPEAGDRARWIIEGQVSHISDGVYALENLANTNRWMDTQGNFTDPDSYIQQYAYTDCPTVEFERGGLFKISQVGETGRYVIRLMMNNMLGFTVSDGYIKSKTILTSDDEIEADDTFFIQFWNGAYLIKPYASDNVISSRHSTASGAEGAPDSYLSLKDREDAGDMGKWELYKYSGVSKYGILYSVTGAYTAGRTVELRIKPWSTRIDVNEPYCYTNDSDIASIMWYSSSHYGKIKCHDEGTAEFYMTIRNSEKEVVHMFTVDKYIELPFEEGVYYIKNKELENFMQIDNDDSPDYSTEGAIIEMWYFDAGNHEKWELIHEKDGYYRFRSYKSGYCLSVPSGYLYSEVNLEQLSATSSDGQLWSLTAYTDGSFVVRNKASKSSTSDWCMSVRTGVGSNGRNVMQKEYTADGNYLDRWFFHKCVGADEIFLLGIEAEENHDHYSALINCTPKLFSLGYKEVSFIVEDYFPKSTYLSYLQASTVYVSRSHGGSDGSMSFLSLSDNGTSYVYSTDIYDYGKDEALISLDDCELLLFVACKTASGEHSLPYAAVAAGAECAIGFENSIPCNLANEWTEAFFNYLLKGYSAESAVQKTRKEFYNADIRSVVCISNSD